MKYIVPFTNIVYARYFNTVKSYFMRVGRHGINRKLQNNAAQRVIGNRDRKFCFFSDAPIQVLQERATAGEHDAAVADVSGGLGRYTLEEPTRSRTASREMP